MAVRRRSTRVAWAMLAAWSASVAALVVLSLANGNFQRQPLANTVGLLLAFAAFMGVGALIVAHRLVRRLGLVPDGGAGLVFTPLLFPDGRPPSPPWRLVAWLTGAVTALVAALAAVQPAIELDDGHVVDNPIGVAGVGDPEESLLSVALGLLVLAAVASLVVRFRRSRGEERLQLKWFTYAGALLPLVLLGDFLPSSASNVLFAVGISFLPVAAGIAILRYRLYEIDRLINRTLVYGLLTVLLAGVYAGLVLVLGELSGGLAGGTPSWVVAGATLAVAALFQPARRRVQAVVDRRFNRRRYDAARTVEGFAVRLRDQVDLQALHHELLAVVDQTVAPTRASLWLRAPRRRG